MSFTEAQKEGLLNAMRSDPIAMSDVVAETCQRYSRGYC